jgi:hypothetical protein
MSTKNSCIDVANDPLPNFHCLAVNDNSQVLSEDVLFGNYQKQFNVSKFYDFYLYRCH